LGKLSVCASFAVYLPIPPLLLRLSLYISIGNPYLHIIVLPVVHC